MEVNIEAAGGLISVWIDGKYTGGCEPDILARILRMRGVPFAQNGHEIWLVTDSTLTVSVGGERAHYAKFLFPPTGPIVESNVVPG